MLSTHRTAHHYHYIAPVVTPAYVHRRGVHHASVHHEAVSPTPTPTPTATPAPDLSIALTPGADMDLTEAAGNEMESQIAVNPADHNNIVMVAQNDVDGGKTINYSVTTDGGLTWNRTTVGGDEDGFDPENNRADARVIFDAYGNLYVVYMVAAGPNEVDIVCLHSFDKGQTFNAVTTAVDGTRYNPDSPWLATGPSLTHPGQQVVWMSFTDLKGQLIDVTGITSGGLGNIGDWSTPSDVSDGFGTYSSIAIGPKGQIAVAWQQNAEGSQPTPLLFNVDTTGTGEGFGPDDHVFYSNVGGADVIPAQKHRSIDVEVKLAYDCSGGPANGRLYFVYTEAPDDNTTDTNIYLRYSDNNGQTFSKEALRVNDDTGANSQFLPALAVDQSNGDVGITWYDARNNVNNIATEIFGAVSKDYGLTFSKNVQISDGLTDTNWKGISTNNLDYGDNNSAAFVAGKLYAVWSDNTNSTGDNPDGTHAQFDILADVVSVT